MTLLFSAGFGAFVLASGVAILLWSWAYARKTSDGLCKDSAALMRHEWQDGAHQTEVLRARAALDELAEDQRYAPVLVFVVSGSGHLLASSPHSLPTASPDPLAKEGWQLIRQRLGTASGVDFTSNNLSQRWQWAIQVVTDGDTGDSITILAAMDTRPAWRSLQEQAVLLAVLGTLAVAAATRAAWVLVGRTLQPIDAVSRQAATASETASDAISAQLTPPSDDAEVRHLVQTMNALLSRIHDNTQRREQWYAAAAHELRTPLAVLSGSLEVALNRPRTQSEYEETLQSLQAQTRRLIALSEGVLLLSRLDAKTDSEDAFPVSLAESCQQTLDAFAPLIEARALNVTVTFDDAVPLIIAPPSHIAMLTRNLLENAMKYAPDGGRVRVFFDTGSGGAELRIFNTHDMRREPLDFGRIFDPFYREKHVKSAGSGLGLAICRRLADANGWHLEMTEVTGGVCVTVVFPSHSSTHAI